MDGDIVIPEFGAYCEYSWNCNKFPVVREFAKNLHLVYKLFYSDVEVKIIDCGSYYKVVLYCRYALRKEWIFKIEIDNNHLLLLIGLTNRELHKIQI